MTGAFLAHVVVVALSRSSHSVATSTMPRLALRMDYCEKCFASYRAFARADLLSRSVTESLSSGRVPVPMVCGRFCFVGGDPQVQHLWTYHVLPFLRHCPAKTPNACGSFGRQAQLACMWRELRLMPLLKTCLDLWVAEEGQERLSCEQYHETIEIILMFIQGKSNNVPRPLPAISGLKKHGYL